MFHREPRHRGRGCDFADGAVRDASGVPFLSRRYKGERRRQFALTLALMCLSESECESHRCERRRLAPSTVRWACVATCLEQRLRHSDVAGALYSDLRE
jgi:hypothetical protein